MKQKYLTLVTLLILASTLIAQNHSPVPLYFNIQNQPTQISLSQPRFKQDNFILGWAWSHGRKMSEAMFCNQAHVGHGALTQYPNFNYPKEKIKNNTNLIICADGVYDAGGSLTGANSQSLCYSPVLRITNTGSPIPNPKKYVFGFSRILVNIPVNPAEPDFNLEYNFPY